ncbi:DUF2877 domain-containing protein [Paenibacillus sp. MSJ-34]|uniref:DUF2877 domain-containing protein n=1 Tax=Paenibacillus sp. MSJ-34 TaxID=2841529 RepID=UPI001C116164|nr:DUF2877 domain-containing protein [Paenibacillus sp. MSJ-34]MBU5444343.1 DUF2877 domain-containing protein [Paenibacillus sp. MSJ-34]
MQRIRNSAFLGSVHSRFDRTVNVQCTENGELYTIAACTIDNGPNTIVIRAGRLSGLGIAAGDRVYADRAMLYVERKLAVSIADAAAWKSALPNYPLDDRRLRRNLIAAKAFVELEGKNGGMKRAAARDNLFDAEVSKRLEERSSSLLFALSKGDTAGARDHALTLIGLGPGLTPSGDDYLLGLFTIVNLPNSPLRRYRPLCADIANEAAGLTNPISHMGLIKAAAGQVRESVVELLRSLTDGDPEQAIRSLKAVLNIGSSSGTDIAMGLIHGLELIAQHRWR